MGVFDNLADGAGGSESATDHEVHGVGTLTQKKAQLAYEEIFEKWGVSLTGEQEQTFESDHFIPKWKEYVGSNEFG